MAVIVLAVSGRDVLICNSGKFLADQNWIPGNELRAAQRVDVLGGRVVTNTEQDKQAAITIFLQRADQFTQRLNQHIKVGNVEWKPASPANPARGIPALPNRFTTRFLYPMNPAGFIKGTYPDLVFPGETPKQAAAREFFEETGTRIDLGRFQNTPDPNVFILNISPAEKQSILNTWGQLRTGELYQLYWVPIAEVCATPMHLNQQCQYAVQYLPRAAGRTIRRKKSARSKKRGTSKQGVRR